jgi:hypothetical protein
MAGFEPTERYWEMGGSPPALKSRTVATFSRLTVRFTPHNLGTLEGIGTGLTPRRHRVRVKVVTRVRSSGPRHVLAGGRWWE